VDKRGKGEFTGKKFTFAAPGKTLEELKAAYMDNNEEPEGAIEWRNRRPICPYGCGEEGTLMEVVVKDGKAIGFYTHSQSVKPFTAELEMLPSPTSRKLVLGLDGEMHEEVNKEI
jgi:hypothetical protein